MERRPWCEPQRKIHNDKMLSAFWEELLQNGGALYNEEIDIKIQNYGLALDMTVPYLIVLFSVKYTSGLSMRNEENLIHCIFRWKNTGFFRVSEKITGIVVPMKRHRKTADIAALCDEYIRFMCEVWSCKVSVFIGQPLYMDKLTEHFNCLLEMERRIAGAKPQIYMYESVRAVPEIYGSPGFTLWEALIERELYGKALEDIKGYFDTLENVKQSFLANFLQELDRMLYRIESKRQYTGISIFLEAGRPGDDTAAEHDIAKMYTQRCDSLDSAMNYISWAVGQLKSLGQSALEGTNDPVQSVCAYVREHMDEDISRERLADVVHLNADYLGRLFRKENGNSLKAFILKEKMAFARELLEKNSMSVSEAALCVGFRNFAHFSTAFKKLYGISPSQCKRAGLSGKEI